MKKSRFIIPALKRVAEEAKKQLNPSEELILALKELEEVRIEEKQRYKESLEHRGTDCVVCGKRFLPLPDDYSACCSIGCRLK